MHETQPVTGDDEPPGELECDEWINNFECTEEWNCYEVPDDEPMDPCVYYGVGCDEGGEEGEGGGGNGNDNGDNVDKITDSLSNEKLDCARQKIEDWSAYNGFMNTVVSYFQLINDYTVVLKQYNGTSSGGIAITHSDINDPHKIIISLNVDRLQGAAQELTVEVIFHEFIHAFFKTFDPGDLSYSEHYRMLTSYIDDLVNATQDIFPELTDSDAYALALYGLSGDLAFTGDQEYIDAWNAKAAEFNLTETEINSILAGYESKQKGTACQ